MYTKTVYRKKINSAIVISIEILWFQKNKKISCSIQSDIIYFL